MAKRANRGRGGKKVSKLLLKEASANLEVALRSLDCKADQSEEKEICEDVDALKLDVQSLPVESNSVLRVDAMEVSSGYLEDEFVSKSGAVESPFKVAQKSEAQDWRQLFRKEKSIRTLQYFAPSHEGGRVVVKPPKEAIEEGISKWASSLVEVFLLENGLYLFKFADEKTRDEVMEARVWHMANKPLILRKWTPGMQLLNISLSSVPVWIKLHNLPIEFWNATCLSYVASGVGKPICADSVTEEQLRLGFARVLVEVDMNYVFPKEIEIVGVDGGRVVVGIEYPWLLVKCKKCKLFGHLSHTCTKVEKQVWLPKNTEPVQNLNAGFVVEKAAELNNGGPNIRAEPKWNVVRAKKTLVSKSTVKDNQSNWTNSFHLLARADGNLKSGVRGSDTFSSLQNVIESAMVEESAKIKGKGKMGEEEEGLNHPSQQKEVVSMIKRHKVSLICLIETRVKENKADKVKACIVPDWDYVFNYDKHYLGRIWICWNNSDFEVIVLDKGEQSINCFVKSLNSWFHSFVYGANQGVDRRLLWSDLCSMKGKVGNNPWMICGDFNVVFSLAEKWGSNKLSSYEIEFGQCVNDLEVLDLNFSGCFYTWTNKSEEPWFVARKLDRVLANVNWMSSFGSTVVEFLSGGISDHSPAIISAGSLQSFGHKPFKFYNFWLEHEGFLDWVKEGWSIQPEGFPMYQLYVKRRSVKAILKEKNMVCFGNLKQRVIQARENLTLAQNGVLASFGSANSLLKERECLHAYVSITRAEESFLKQKVQNAKKTINYLWDEHGTKVDDVDQIKKVAEDFYKNLLAILEKEVIAEEIRDTLFHMKANKAPGPYGFSADFFKSTWSIVGQEVVAAIKGKKGLRQGDPLYPYLFVLAMEVFSRIMADHTSEASLSSIKVIKAALLEFENLSGLKANPAKSSFYCSGISDRLKYVLLDDLRMKKGHLPMRQAPVVIFCSLLQVYWMGIFILPKKIIRAIEQKFNRFLWNGKEEGVAKAKVAWSDLCFPKKEGGLGLKRLEVWNQTSMLRHIWSIFARSGSIWVAWLRDIAKRFLKFEAGNGDNIHMWLDLWHPVGILIEQYGFRAVYDAQSNIEAKLSSVICNGDWFWKPVRSEALVDIEARLSKVCLGQCDKPIWLGSKKGVYVSAETWEALREKNAKVKGYLNGVIRVIVNAVFVIVKLKLVITSSLNAVLVLEYENIAWFVAGWIGLLLSGIILCS
ncbi:uncharacterized protein LOC132174022 [Corylus avellana]|uniref:uncharacterized protein LOC132174022 n=1 Tax=Corylus avellana TaxID=13451 RepID=UPI00286CF1AD|nr:uncharacterized protein LOC132174022 [Corylus avellana]